MSNKGSGWYWVRNYENGGWAPANLVGDSWYNPTMAYDSRSPIEIGPRIPTPDEGRLVALPNTRDGIIAMIHKAMGNVTTAFWDAERIAAWLESLGQQEAGE